MNITVSPPFPPPFFSFFYLPFLIVNTIIQSTEHKLNQLEEYGSKLMLLQKILKGIMSPWKPIYVTPFNYHKKLEYC